MKTRTWVILGGLIVCVVLAVVVVTAFSPGVSVRAAPVQIGRAWECIEERAKTRLPLTYLITMPYNGRIKEIAKAEGSRVREGDPVAQIVEDDLKWALAEAKAALGEADAATAENEDISVEESVLEQVRQIVESMKITTEAAWEQVRSSWAAWEYADRDLARTRKLHEARAQSDDELEQAILLQDQRDAEFWQAFGTYAALDSLQIATNLLPEMVRRFIARKRLSGAVLRQRRAQVDARLKRALLDWDRGTMRSPVDGVVLKRRVTNERLVSAGTVLLEIGRPEDLQVEADVLSQDVVGVRKDDPVEIYGPAVGERRSDGKDHADGKVDKIYPAGFTKISSLGVEQQRVKVIVRIDAEDIKWLREERALGVGYRVRVRIFTAEPRDALVVPRSALFRGTGGQWQVYAIRRGRARIQEVQLGLMNDESVQITSGLKDGEQVVLAPESDLTDGARVTVEEERE